MSILNEQDILKLMAETGAKLCRINGRWELAAIVLGRLQSMHVTVSDIGYLVDQDLIVKTDDDTFVLADSSEEHRAA